jgi:hypothetical protein
MPIPVAFKERSDVATGVITGDAWVDMFGVMEKAKCAGTAETESGANGVVTVGTPAIDP